MNKLLIFAKSIEDFRMNRKKVHPAENIVFITVLALICDALTWEEIADFGKSRKDYLSQFLDLENGIPSHDTFNRFFSLYCPEKFQELFVNWIQELLDIKIDATSQIAIDGKSSRSVRGETGKMLHLLNAFLVGDQCILGQQKTETKSNEITAIPLLLEVLDLKGALVSIDAMGCQREIATQIVAQESNYFLAVKQNQKTLYEDIESAFLVFKENNKNSFTTEEINGSRIEKRVCKVMDDLSHLSTQSDWTELKKIVKIETETYLKSKEKMRSDVRYYITNKEDTPDNYLKFSRNHWQVENNLHWSLDVILDEDKSRKRNNNVAENFSIMLKVILALLKEKQKNYKRVSIKRMRKRAAWDLNFLNELMDF